jgi:predicted molibdopterin-dependent oxidoreductase YjgC
MNHSITLTIDGRGVAVAPGATLLNAAQRAGVYIPTLCADDHLEPYGACRLCLVAVEGDRRPMLPACTTPATDGMVVRTSSDLIDRTRRNIVELILSDHPEDCLICPQNGRCDLQEVAAYVGVRQMRFRGEKSAYAIDSSNPFYEQDLERCILCGKCVRTCDEIQGRGAIHYAYRGFQTKIAAPLDRPLAQSTCESCGQCVVKCPVGALRTKSMVRFGRPTGETATTCTYCGVGCGLILETRDGRIIGARGNPASPTQGRTCVKGAFGYGFVNHPDRLTTPLIREGWKMENGKWKMEDHETTDHETTPDSGSVVSGQWSVVSGQFSAFREATWDEALSLVAQRLAETKETHGSHAIGVLASAKCTNEENYLIQKFARAVVGTNNVDHCARL